MLKYELNNFVSQFKEKDNIILKIFVKHFDEILIKLSEGNKYCLSDYITNIAEGILKQKISLSDYERLDFLKYEEKINKALSSKELIKKIYISKLYISGLKGFTKINEKCRSRNNQECKEDAIINLEEGKSAIIFGWNGEGKSSITESIEFALTGDVEERRRRNKKSLSEYLLNVNSNEGIAKVELIELYNPLKKISIERKISSRSKEPASIKEENEKEESRALAEEIRGNIEFFESLFHKCFIERNRIENFILAKGAEKKRRYSDLLGLSDLNDLIDEYWKKVDTQSKDKLYECVENEKQKYIEMCEKRSNLKKTIIENISINEFESEKIKKLGFEIKEINDKNIEMIYQNVMQEKLKLDDERKSIDKIEKLLNNIKEYKELKNRLTNTEKNIFETNIGLLMEIYERAIQIIDKDSKECPLCGNTNFKKGELLEIITKNKNKIEENKEIVKIKEQIDKKTEKLYSEVSNLFDEYKGELKKFKEDLDNELIARRLEKEKNEREEKIKDKEKDINEVFQIISKYRNIFNEIRRNKDELKKLEEEIKLQEEKMHKEEETNKLKKMIVEDLKEFEKGLKEYRDSRIKEELMKLTKNIKEYYNKFEGEETIEEVAIIENGKDDFTLYVKFLNDNKQYDPLIVLSEGQLRCLGLAILFSMAKNQGLSFLILDDIVNAIDIEHRANIVKVLKEEIENKNVQMIITTHDKLFKEKIVNMLNNRKRIISLKFVTKCQLTYEKEINFEEKIERSIKEKDCRSAIMYMRIWLENLIYELAEGVKVPFKDKIYNYKLNEIFEAVKQNYNELEPVYDFFMKADKLYWGILNQENHFWSEQSINLDCTIIREMLNWIKAVKEFSKYKKLDDSYKEKIKTYFLTNQNQGDSVISNNFHENELSILKRNNWINENNEWTNEFKCLMEKLINRQC